MAASYSSFITTQFYSPVFNTALFDGPFRIYFSQSYESTALKIYHLIQTQNFEIWSEYKKWSEKTKRHAFILIYPSYDDLEMAFDLTNINAHKNSMTEIGQPNLSEIKTHIWDEGFILGLHNMNQENDFQRMYEQIIFHLNYFISQSSLVIDANVPSELEIF